MILAEEVASTKSAEAEIRQIIQDWARSVSQGNREAILTHHSRDLLMFDFPDTKEGIKAYDDQWNYFYEDPQGPIRFTPSDVRVTAGDDVAFVTCMVHCEGTSAGALDFRLTTGLRKVDGEWAITHEHHSVPTIEKRFLGGN